MSGHLIGCAGQIDDDARLGTSHKLALLAFADSADDRTHIAFPGYEGVQKWAMVSRGRAAELIRDLVDWGYLEHHKRGRRGQRAEYVVFPGGCCDLHRTPAEEAPVDVDQLAAAAGVPVEQARALLAALHNPEGSDAPDAMTGTGSDRPDPNTPAMHNTPTTPVETTPEGSDAPDPEAGKGPESVHGSRSTANAFPPSTTTPLPPASGGTCIKHPTPVANCRGCGTTNRQLAAQAQREAADRRRAEALAAAAAERAIPKGTKPGTEPIKARVRAEHQRGKQNLTTTGAPR